MVATLKTWTLGCKVNQYETEFVREALLGIGYRDAAAGEPADLCVVNTCTVTAEGDAKSRQVIRRLARENPAARIVVMGCYATRAPDEVASLPGVTDVITDKRELPDWLARFGVADVPTGISQFQGRSRAYVKVQDGCLLRCSYCIIPHVRPPLTSRPLPLILDEVRRLRDHGYREIVLTGIHLGHYGVEGNWGKSKSEWTRLWHLVREIACIEGDFRVRLSSLEATEVTRELVQVMADYPEKICPHLHLCLQSGSDAVLRRMRRRWSARMFLERCEMVRRSLDQPAFTTDVIVGFPGETDEDFEQTCRLVREVGFSKVHIFPFSPRRGTSAAQMPDRVPDHVRGERGRHLAVIEHELREQYFRSLIGRNLRVLLEAPSDATAGHAVGTSCRYAPVELPSGSELGKLVDVVARDVIAGLRIWASPI
ncbi:MAG TPA: tRNA (N(6)-L-threonylcarbamoyladenosine(37)-C(2))-methylthiotransferase MtaB [Candidatus Anammoximicrobium sp.]|nr:tRNA (N(6)-L-threonylcarbamoyladenosine(37)-C(2))-methylthiotransferase MtaB [Candidatus Anammoximicrobium sp.]